MFRIRLVLIVIAGILIGRAAESAPSRQDLNFSLLAHRADGPSATVAVVGNTALLGHGGYVEILDVADPNSPLLLNRYRIEGFISAIALAGNLAFVNAESRGIHLLDVTDPLAVEPVAFLPLGDYFRKFVVVDTKLYVCTSAGFSIVDITDPTAPQVLGFFERPNLGAFDIWGHHAYISESPGNLIVLNVADPAAPFAENVLPPEPGMPLYTAIECADGLLHGIKRNFYGFHSFSIFDLADPVHPAPRGLLTGDLDLTDLAVEGDWLHFITSDSLLVYDAVDPNDLRPAGSAPLLDVPRDIDARAGLVFVAEPDFGLQCFARSGPHARIDVVDLGGFSEGFHGASTDVARVGDLLVVSATAPGLATYDISDPTDPVLVASLYDHVPGQPDTRGYAVTVHADYAYLRCSEDGDFSLRVIDVSDPADPTEVASLAGALMNVQFREGIGYSMHNYGVFKLHVDDFTNPAAPVAVATFPLTDWTAHLVDGDRLLTITGDHLVVYDISDPQQLVPLGQTDLAWNSPPNFIAIIGRDGLATVAAALSQNHENILRIVDFTDPTAIAVHSGPALGDEPRDLASDAEFLYVATGDGGVESYSLENPLMLEQVGHYRTGFWNWAVSGDGQVLCAADSEDGFYILRNDLAVTASEETPARHPSPTLDNHPNPFNPRTVLVFTLPTAVHTRLNLYDARGRLVRRLGDGYRAAGRHQISWDGRDDRGQNLPSGIYLARLVAGDRTVSKSLVLIR